MTGAQRSTEIQQRILLVDDDEDDYILTRGMLLDLNRAKFQLDWASAYAAGLEQLLNGGYDAALVDYDLGAQKGTELIEAALAGGCQTPMIVFTGRGSYDIDVLAMQSGAVDYINKSEASPALLERSIRYAIERKQAERALAAANEQLQRQKLDVERTNNHLQGLFDHAPAGLALFDPQPPYRVLAHNQVYQNDFPEPYASQGMLGLTLPEFAVSAEADGLQAIFDEVVRSGQANTFYNFAYNGHAGGTIWWNGHLSPVFLEGRLVSLAHTTINVTEQVEATRQVEAELRERLQAEKALQAALARAEEGQRTLEAVMHNVPVGIILTGPPPDFVIQQVSRHVTELTGRPRERLVGLPGGKHQDAWRILLPDGVSRPANEELALWRAAHRGEVIHNQEMMIVGARGRRIPLLVSAAPIRNRHGQTVAAIAVFHDITERKQAE
ncbi:MAG TPA: PAS domain S-box protein, partial [Anaerolineaceae bacterium]|nr:PAS domain S-box protein [Anaerolineaceae bacterium]